MKDSFFVFDCTDLLYYKCHKISLNRGNSYVDSTGWIKRATINPENKDKKFFQYAATVALNQNNEEKSTKSITSWAFYKLVWLKKNNFPSEWKDWEILVINKVAIFLIVLYVEINNQETK